MKTNWKNKKIAILGFDSEILSGVSCLIGLGASVTVFFLKDKEDIDKDVLIHLEKLSCSYIFGGNHFGMLSEFNMFVYKQDIKKDILMALEKKPGGALMMSQNNLFFNLCPCPIIGVTGTKGKGTTAALIYEMLKASNISAYLDGLENKLPFHLLDKLSIHDLLVLELSVSQLQDINKSPYIAVMPMLIGDRLEVFENAEEYIATKRNIVNFQGSSDYAILNRDYPATNESDICTQANVFYVSCERPVDKGCYLKDGAVWVRIPDTGTNSNDQVKEKKVIDIKNIRLGGKFNLENICAAITAALLAGANFEGIKMVLKTFAGLDGHLKLVEEVLGVKYYDDSYSVAPDMTILSMEAFTSPEILILGGSKSSAHFDELAVAIGRSENIKAIIGIGDEWSIIKEKILNVSSNILMIEGAMDMKTVIAAANKIATKGDIVLYSPSCEGFGKVYDYRDCGKEFIREVQEIAKC